MRTSALQEPKLDSPKMTRILQHAHQARLARNAQHELGLSITEIADKAGVHWQTAKRFLENDVKDPRTATTARIFAVLGYSLTLVRK